MYLAWVSTSGQKTAAMPLLRVYTALHLHFHKHRAWRQRARAAQMSLPKEMSLPKVVHTLLVEPSVPTLLVGRLARGGFSCCTQGETGR